MIKKHLTIKDHYGKVDVKINPEFKEMFNIEMISERVTPNGFRVNHYPVNYTVDEEDLDSAIQEVNSNMEATIEEAILHSIFEGKNYSNINPIDFLFLAGKRYSEEKFEEYRIISRSSVEPSPWSERRSQKLAYVEKGRKLGTIYFSPANRFSTFRSEGREGYIFTFEIDGKVEVMGEVNLIVVLENPEYIYLE